MNYACYGKPCGDRVTPQEFIRRASPRYKERGIFPYCEACGEKVDLYGVHTPNGPTRFDHANFPTDADPLDDCILANRNARFRGMQPESFDFPHGQQLRKNFFEEENLKRAYCFMWNLCGKNNFPIKSMRKCIERADRKNIWAYSGIKIWCIPYILLTLENFFHHKNYYFHFYINKKKSTFLSNIWTKNESAKLYKVFTDSGKSIEKSPNNPLIFSENNFLTISNNTSWIVNDHINKIKSSFM